MSGACRFSWLSRPGLPQCETLVDLASQLRDVSLANVGRVISRLERIVQLRIAESVHEFTRPDHVGGGQALQDVRVPASIIELDPRTPGRPDQFERLVVIDVVPCAANIRKSARLPERGAHVLDHVSTRGLGLGVAHAIDSIVARLQVVVVQEEVDGNQTLEGPRAREGILEPRPFTFAFMIGLESESCRLAL